MVLRERAVWLARAMAREEGTAVFFSSVRVGKRASLAGSATASARTASMVTRTTTRFRGRTGGAGGTAGASFRSSNQGEGGSGGTGPRGRGARQRVVAR